MFIDRITIHIKAGNGGNGAVSFRREKYVAAGGPDGGDGGHGGNIVFRVDKGCNTLLAFRYHRKFVAGNGGNGAGSKFHGATAEDLFIMVPPGTLIKDPESGKIIHDMSENEGADYLCLKGGRGGWGNRHFSTPTRQVPMFAKNGTEGEERDVLLELKMLADVGLVGFPSVGKSSLLSVISSARPKIADYHFTTLSPNLGVVSIEGGKGFVAGDIPGLIEGASEGAGLGHEFLRHIDRCRLLWMVVDMSCLEERNPIDDLEILQGELEKYNPELSTRPKILVANKMDAHNPELADLDTVKQYAEKHGWGFFPVSAVTKEGISALVQYTGKLLETLPPLKIYEAEYEAPEVAVGRETEIKRENDTFFVTGDWLKKVMGSINFSDYESFHYFQKVLQKAGIFEKLEEKGCKEGNTVDIYGFQFDYVL